VVKVSVEVRSGAGRFEVAVRAESIRRAVEIVENRYLGTNVGVKFPIDPENLFVEDPATRAGIADLKQLDRMAA
jgi:hypothetical protein